MYVTTYFIAKIVIMYMIWQLTFLFLVVLNVLKVNLELCNLLNLYLFVSEHGNPMFLTKSISGHVIAFSKNTLLFLEKASCLLNDFRKLCMLKVQMYYIYDLLICTLISENPGLQKSRSVSNRRKNSGPANLDVF